MPSDHKTKTSFGYSGFGSNANIVDAAKWLFPQERATLHDEGVSTHEPKPL
jgi:hypothetical protein